MSGALTISVPEAARRLGISKPTAYILARRDDFPAFQVSEKRWLVYAEGLEEWVKTQVQQKSEVML